MIKTKNLVILAAVLVVLAGLSVIQRTSHRKSTGGSTETVVLPGVLDKDDVGRITVGLGPQADQLVLQAGPEGWTCPTKWNARVNVQRLESLLRNLSDLAGEFRSDSEAVLGDYDLTPDKSVKIRLYAPDGAELAGLDAGGKSERSPGNFIRRPGENAVYLTQKSVLSSLGMHSGPAVPKASHFLDLQAVQKDRLLVDRIVLEVGSQALEMAKVFAVEQPAEDDTTGAEPTIDRNTWEWKATAPRKVSLAKTKADGVLSAAVNIRAVDVADPETDLAGYGLTHPTRRARLFLADGEEFVLEFGNLRPAAGEDPAGYWLRVWGDPTVWVVTEYAADNVFKELDELLPE